MKSDRYSASAILRLLVIFGFFDLFIGLRRIERGGLVNRRLLDAGSRVKASFDWHRLHSFGTWDAKGGGDRCGKEAPNCLGRTLGRCKKEQMRTWCRRTRGQRIKRLSTRGMIAAMGNRGVKGKTPQRHLKPTKKPLTTRPGARKSAWENALRACPIEPWQ